MNAKPAKSDLVAELADVRARLSEAEEVLRAIRNGDVDAVRVTGKRGEKIYTLTGADSLYRQLIETMSEGAATVSADGVITYCNGRLARMLERPLEQVMGTALRNYVPPADQQALDAVFAQAGTEPSRREINLKTSHGGLVPIYLSASRLQDEAAGPMFCIVLTDLTQQRSHEQLAAMERQARLILEQAAEAIVVCDEQGRVIRVSQAAKQFCNGSPLLRPFVDVFRLRTDAGGPFHLAPVLQGKALTNVDVALDRRGQELNLILNAGPLLSDQQILGCVVTLTDITERKRATEAEARLAAILEATPDLVGIADPEGRFVYMNRAGRKMLGRDELTDLSGTNIREFHDAASVHVVLTEGIPTAMREGAWSGETSLVALDGHAIAISQVILAHKAPDGTVRLVSTIARDITERKQAEVDLRESEGRLAEAERVARIGSWEWTIATGVIEWSDGMGHVLGRDRGLPAPTFDILASFFAPESWERLGAVIARTIETGASYELDLEMVRADGTMCWTTTRGEAIRGADGTVVKLRGTVHDIADRKRADDELREKDYVLSESQRLGHVGSWFWEMAGPITWSEEMYRIYGVSPDTFLPSEESLIGLIYPDDRPAMQSWMAACAAGEQPAELEFRISLCDGTIRHLLGRGEAVLGVGNRPGYMAGTAQDITHSKRIEEDLRRLATAVEQATESITITDANARILYVNPAFERTSGYTRKEAIGEGARLLKSGTHDAEFYRRMWALLIADHAWKGRLTNKRKDGTLYEEDVSISPVRDPAGQIVNYVAVARDVTREIALEGQLRQAQKMETVGRLAGGIAHDFNNLLTVINGTAELASRYLREEDPLRADLESIRQAGERAASLTRQLLAFSRKQVMKLDVLSLSSRIASLEGMLQRLIGENIALVVVSAKEVGNVLVDASQIEQVVMNLVVNARDAMLDGGTLTIEVRNVELDAAYAARHPSVQPGPHVMLAVSDTGTGMDEATRARLFEPFFSTKDPGQGTGLGLATVYGIVEQSGGSISVRSELGKGTTVTIYLPRVEAAEIEIQPTPTVSSMQGSETVLIVEDEVSVCRLAKRILDRAGYTVLTASNGAEALLLLDRHDGPVHLMLTDVVLPGMSGRDLAERFAAIRSGMKVLYTSGYTDDEILRHGVLDRAFHFIGKPYTAAALTRQVREVLDS